MNGDTIIEDADIVVVNNRIAASSGLETKPSETLFGYVKEL
ncbi:hypothetical protein [Brevundimonas sp. TSRC1-1]